MTEQPQNTSTPEGPWNPGLQSQIPADLLPLATIYRPEHVRTTLREARELADLTGLPMEDLVAFRPERLVVHELLARVTADFTVEDGQKTEDLGINFRRMTDALLTRHIAPHMAEIVAAYNALRAQIHTAVSTELERGLHEDAGLALPRRGFWAQLFGQGKTAPINDEGETTDVRAIRYWLAARPEVSDTKIGAWGLSYGGGAILNSLVAGVPWGAAVTVETWTDLYTALMPQDLVKSGVVAGLAGSIPENRRDPSLAALQAAAFARQRKPQGGERRALEVGTQSGPPGRSA